MKKNPSPYHVALFLLEDRAHDCDSLRTDDNPRSMNVRQASMHGGAPTIVPRFVGAEREEAEGLRYRRNPNVYPIS